MPSNNRKKRRRNHRNMVKWWKKKAQAYADHHFAGITPEDALRLGRQAGRGAHRMLMYLLYYKLLILRGKQWEQRTGGWEATDFIRRVEVARKVGIP